tara:strand:- start:95 stop:349 length:255 start_codon:yes stop_codon:yes gene_type:complete
VLVAARFLLGLLVASVFQALARLKPSAFATIFHASKLLLYPSKQAWDDSLSGPAAKNICGCITLYSPKIWVCARLRNGEQQFIA